MAAASPALALARAAPRAARPSGRRVDPPALRPRAPDRGRRRRRGPRSSRPAPRRTPSTPRRATSRASSRADLVVTERRARPLAAQPRSRPAGARRAACWSCIGLDAVRAVLAESFPDLVHRRRRRRELRLQRPRVARPAGSWPPPLPELARALAEVDGAARRPLPARARRRWSTRPRGACMRSSPSASRRWRAPPSCPSTTPGPTSPPATASTWWSRSSRSPGASPAPPTCGPRSS